MAAILLSLLGGGWGLIKGGLKWLSARSLAELACIALALFAVLEHFELADARHDRDAWHRQFDAEHKARQADRRSYEQAQKDAAAKNHAQVEQIRSKQEAITDDVKSDLNSRLELIRRELRKPALQGAPGGPGTGEAGPTPCRAYDPAWLCVAPAERLRAAENEERHDQLITWAERQSKVQ